jgi:hypothetical protein
MTADQSMDVPIVDADVLVDGEAQTYERPKAGQGVSTTLPGMCLVDLAMKASRASASG